MPTILLADDSITIQKIVNLTFSGEGIDVVTVGNGEAAVKKIHELHPALVLADIFMPGKNGYEVCDYIKNEPSLSATPVILLVGAFEPFDSAEAARVKADGHLTKPFEIKVLISAVNSLITATSGQKEDIAEPIDEAAVSEPPEVPQVADVAEDQPAVHAFAPLPEMPTAARVAEPDETAAWPSPEPTPTEVAPPMALGVDIQDVEVPPPLAPELAAEAVSATNNLVEAAVETRMPEPQPPAPSLMIEESDPLGLLSGDSGLGTGSEIALDARSMVVDIWEPRTATPVEEPAASPEPIGVSVEESVTESFTVQVPIPESIIEPVREEPAATESVVSNAAPGFQPSAEPSTAPTVVSEELIERIANRVVEKLSREVIERIAWEVVPDLAELMIKEHVEAHMKESQPR